MTERKIGSMTTAGMKYNTLEVYLMRPKTLSSTAILKNVMYYEAGEPKTFDGDLCDYIYVYCSYEDNGKQKPIELYVETNPYDYGYYDDCYDDPYMDYDEDEEINDLELELYDLAKEYGIDSSKFIWYWDM